MTDYSNCIIYKLVGECGGVYIGHTVDMRKRENNHSCFRNDCMSRELVNPIMEEVEKYPCNNFTEARMREQYWMDLYPECVNKIRAYITEQQRKELQEESRIRNFDKPENKEKRRVRAKEYRAENPSYYDYRNLPIPCDICGKMTNKRHISRHKKTKKCMDAKNI